MAVYTELSNDDIERVLEKYNVGSLVGYSPIMQGVENTNYIINTTQDKFILTLFEKRVREEDLPYFMNFKKHLVSRGINCPKAINSKDELNIIEVRNKKAALISFLNGSQVMKGIEPSHCLSLGGYLAKMHLAAMDFTQKRKNLIGIDSFRDLYNSFASKADNVKAGLSNLIETELAFLDKQDFSSLPMANIHADLFPDNVFYDEKGEVCAVIDFYFACYDYLIYDFAICAVAWCFDENGRYIPDRFNALLSGYQNVRKFEPCELDFMRIMLRAASLRFLLSRAHDLIFHPAGSFVTPKDPVEYINKLEFFSL